MKNELRIGNFVKIHQSKIQMTELDFRFRSDFFKPIKLTEEWLLKFGFEYASYANNYIIEAGEYYNSVKFDKRKWLYNNDSSDASCYGVTTIKYVHQLQNLYFALNQKELIITNK